MRGWQLLALPTYRIGTAGCCCGHWLCVCSICQCFFKNEPAQSASLWKRQKQNKHYGIDSSFSAQGNGCFSNKGNSLSPALCSNWCSNNTKQRERPSGRAKDKDWADDWPVSWAKSMVYGPRSTKENTNSLLSHLEQWQTVNRNSINIEKVACMMKT